VSERIRTYGSDRPIAGDLVFDISYKGKEELMEADAEEDNIVVEPETEESCTLLS